MKSLITFFLLLSFASLSSQEINPKLYEKTWLDNDVRYYNGYAITKIFGQLPHMPRAYNFMPITAISYKDLSQLKEEVSEQMEVDSIAPDDRDYLLSQLEKEAKGGELEIYISRYDEEQANFRWFFVILRGMDDKGKLWEKYLDYQAPQNPYERGWWNFITLPIPVDVTTPFYVYLNDKSSKYLSDFKFKVESAAQQAIDE